MHEWSTHLRSSGNGRSIGKELMGPVDLGEGVLCSEHPLGGRAMSLSFGVLLKGVGHADGPVAQVLAIHSLHSCITCVKAGIVDECKTFRVTSVWITHNLRERERELINETFWEEGAAAKVIIHLRCL